VISPLDLPSKNTSAMDGYALVASSTLNPPVTLRVVGEAPAGCTSPPSIKPGEAVLVATGSPIPPGADTVIKVEEVEETKNFITIHQHVHKGDLINVKGQEVKKGQILLSAGALLDYRKTALLASTGTAKIDVFSTPKVALLSTGDELLEPSQPFVSGKVYNANRYIVEGILRREGISPDYLGIFPDDPDILRKALTQALGEYSVVVTMGAVSKGKYDYLRQVLAELEVELHITSTNIKPGHPLAFGSKEGTLFWGLPGYPSATLVNALVYLLPAIRKMRGKKECLPATITALAGESFKSKKDRVYFIRVNLQQKENRVITYSAGSQLTSNYLSSALCKGLAILPEGTEKVNPGEEVRVIIEPL